MSSVLSRFNEAEGTVWKFKASYIAEQKEKGWILSCEIESFGGWVTFKWQATSVASLYPKGPSEPA